MSAQIINGVPYVAVPLPWLIETMHKAFGDAKMERLTQPPTAAELDAAYVSADIRAAERGEFDYGTLRMEAAEYEHKRRRLPPVYDERIGEEEYSNRWMR